MTSFTPRRPRRVSLRRNAVQNGSASEGPMSMPSTSRRPSLLTPTAMITATETEPQPRLRGTKYQQLVGAGKPAKIAITAVMRKLVVTANALLKADRCWTQSLA